MTTQIPWGWIIGGIAAGAAFGLTVPVATQPSARRNPIGAKRNPVDLKTLQDEYGIDGSGKTRSEILQEVEKKLQEQAKADSASVRGALPTSGYDPSKITGPQKVQLDSLKYIKSRAEADLTAADAAVRALETKIAAVEAMPETTKPEKQAKTSQMKDLKALKKTADSKLKTRKLELANADRELKKKEKVFAKSYKDSLTATSSPKVKSLEHIVYQLWEDEDEEEAADQREREIMKKALQRSKEKRPSLYGSGTKVKRRSRNN
jgi:hypothetical protein